VPYAKLEPYVDVIDYVLLTHIHKDHFNKQTMIKLAIRKPNICFYCCEWLEQDLRKIGITHYIVLKPNEPFNLQHDPKIIISPFLLYHDVENCGYRILFDKFKLFHATDTVTLDGIEAKNYHAYFIEANHSEEQIDREIQAAQEEGKFTHKIGAKNSHLSIEQANEFIKDNWNGKAIIKYLHISSDFNIEKYEGEKYAK